MAMSKYIERKIAFEMLIEPRTLGDGGCEWVEKTLHQIPAADVAPVVHARWEYIPQTLDTLSQFRCSVCGWWSLDPSIDNAYNYCPNCGAKMDEDGHMVNKVYIYKSHLGGLYVETDDIPWDDLYCETCGDSDELLFSTDNLEDVAKYFRDEGEMYLVSDIQSVYNICETLLKEE